MAKEIPLYQDQVVLNERPPAPMQWRDPRRGMVNWVGVDGDNLGGLALKFQNDADNARADASILEYRKQMYNERFGVKDDGSDGWGNLRGAAALDADEEGNGLVDRYDKRLKQFKAGLLSKLNDRQKAIFNKKAEPYEADNWAAMRQHTFNQFYTYRKSTLEEGAKTEADAMVKSGEYADTDLGLKAITADGIEMGKLNGWSAAQTSNWIREHTSGAVGAVLQSKIDSCIEDPKNIRDAQAYFETYKKYLNAGQVVQFQRIIEKQNIENSTRATVDEVTGFVKKKVPGFAPTDANKNTKLGGFACGNSPSGAGFSDDTRAVFDTSILGVESGGQHTDKDGNLLLGKYADGTSPTDERAKSWGVAQVSGGTAIETAIKYGYLSGDEAKDAQAALKSNDQKKIADISKKLLSDERMNYRLGLHYFDDLVQKYGDWRKAVCAYNQGPATVDKMVAAAKKAGDPEAWLTFGTEQAQKYVAAAEKRMKTGAENPNLKTASDVTMALYGPRGGFQAAQTEVRRDVVEKALIDRNKYLAANPELLEKAVNQVMANAARENADLQTTYKNRIARGQDIARQLGTAGFFSKDAKSTELRKELDHLRSGLDASGQKMLDGYIENVKLGGDGTDERLLAALSDDGYLRTISDADFDRMRPMLGRRAEVLNIKRLSLQNREGEAQIMQTKSADQRRKDAKAGNIYAEFYKGIPSDSVKANLKSWFPDLKTGSEQFLQFQQVMMDSLATYAQMTGQPINKQNVNGIMQQLYAQRRSMRPGWFGDKEINLITENPNEMKERAGSGDSIKDIARKLAGIRNLQRGLNRPEPTDEDIRTTWAILWANPTAGGLNINNEDHPDHAPIFDKPTWNYVKDSLTKNPAYDPKNGGTPPDDIDILRGYIEFLRRGRTVPTAAKKPAETIKIDTDYGAFWENTD